MKAILIDPRRRDIRGVEVEPMKVNEAFAGSNVKVLLLSTMIGISKVLYYDGYQATVYSNRPRFWIQGLSHCITGKGLLFGRDRGRWPISTELTVREVENLVKFST